MPLSRRRILIAEDLYLVAMPVCEALESSGAEVVGPFSSRAETLAAIENESIDVAILDVGLADGFAFPAARELRRRGVPFLFLTGYDPEMVPQEFAGVPIVMKPTSAERVCQRIVGLLAQLHPN